MMKKALALTLAIGLCICAVGSGVYARKYHFEPRIANPSAIIQEEIAFNQLAQREGQWTAFRKFMAKDATMFVPQPVDAQAWLKGRADPAKSVTWQPHKAFMSCDGKTGVTTGAWQKNGVNGYFTTIWQFFEKRPGSGEWKVIFDHGDELASPREPGEWIETRVASCKGQAQAAIDSIVSSGTMKSGNSRDHSLIWQWVARADGSRDLTISLWNGSSSDRVISDSAAAPKP